jgi:hypothetical protein
VKKSFLTHMYSMALKVYTCQEAASGPKTFSNIFCKLLQQNEPSQPDSGPDSNINSPYCILRSRTQISLWISLSNISMGWSKGKRTIILLRTVIETEGAEYIIDNREAL